MQRFVVWRQLLCFPVRVKYKVQFHFRKHWLSGGHHQLLKLRILSSKTYSSLWEGEKNQATLATVERLSNITPKKDWSTDDYLLKIVLGIWLTIRDVMFRLILPRLMAVWLILLLSMSSFQTWSASWPPIMKMSSRRGENTKLEATKGLALVRLPTEKHDTLHLKTGNWKHMFQNRNVCFVKQGV